MTQSHVRSADCTVQCSLRRNLSHSLILHRLNQALDILNGGHYRKPRKDIEQERSLSRFHWLRRAWKRAEFYTVIVSLVLHRSGLNRQGFRVQPLRPLHAFTRFHCRNAWRVTRATRKGGFNSNTITTSERFGHGHSSIYQLLDRFPPHPSLPSCLSRQ